MALDLLQQLEQKVGHLVELIELMRLQIEELEEENSALRAEHEKWKEDLSSLLTRLDNIDVEDSSNHGMNAANAEKEFEFSDA